MTRPRLTPVPGAGGSGGDAHRVELDVALQGPVGGVPARSTITLAAEASLETLAAAIDSAFGLAAHGGGAHEFRLPGGRVAGPAASEWGEPPIEPSGATRVIDAARPGERFDYVALGRPGGQVTCRVVGAATA